jgi:gamma-glutamylcyclotransferase (GGCT)/AIG2-like uncharacterized protein YtfP
MLLAPWALRRHMRTARQLTASPTHEHQPGAICQAVLGMTTGHSVARGPETRLATYGTLAPGRRNHGQLSDLPGRWIVGHVRGTLIEAGWGAKFGYPGLILDPDKAPIEVLVFESRALPNHWHRLDAFEGPGYRRIAVDVWTAGGVLPASIYVIADPTDAS